jgi:hypothetical protein
MRRLRRILAEEGLIKTAARNPFGGVGMWVVAKGGLSDLDGKPLQRGSIWKIMSIEPRKTLLARIPNRMKDVEDKRDTRVLKKLLKKNFVQGYKPITRIMTMEEAGLSVGRFPKD